MAIDDAEPRASPTSPQTSVLPEPLNAGLPPSPLVLTALSDKHNSMEHTEPQRLVDSPVEAVDDAVTSELTPLRTHYLKKSLISLQFRRELDDITTTSTVPGVSTLSYLGSPFTPPPKGAPPFELPFLRYMFRQFVLTFPFLSSAPKDFFPDKLQPFIASLLSRNLSAINIMDNGKEDMEAAARLKLLAKVEKNFSLLLGSATKLVEVEEVVRLTQADLNRLETLARRREARLKRTQIKFEVNVVCVRTVIDRGRMRSKVHEEFIVRTRRTGFPDIFVSRRYGDFKTLAVELRKMHPEEVVKSPPTKDRTVVTANTPSPSLSPTPVSDSASTANSISVAFQPQQINSADSVASTQSAQSISNIRLARERNRLTLRAYLHSLLTSSTLASSPVLRSFLLSGPTRLSPEEIEDVKRREEADRRREEGRIRFAHEIASRVEGLRSAVKSAKGDIMEKDGLSRIFATVRTTEDIGDLPPEYRAVLEWGRITLASTIFQHFIAADDASETLAGLKRTHGLIPYFMLKGILKISNPVAMIRALLELFLAQPFGGRSLLQRMFTSTLQEEVTALEEDIEAVKDKVDDPIICEKIRLFVHAPREIQATYKSDAASERLNLLTTILRSGEAPALNRVQMHRVIRAHKAHSDYVKQREELADSDDDNGPDSDDAWLYEDLIILAKLYSQLRDKQQLIELIFEGNTAELLKDIITIFYAPLAQVYKAASIADSLGDLQNFINDLIRTVEQAEESGQADPQRIVKLFIDLVQRHEQAFYTFVHKVHSKGEGLFDSLMHWIELFLAAVREGIGEKISLEFLLPHTGHERRELLKEVDEVALYHYKLKVAYEEKLRRRFGHAQGAGPGADADAEDEAAQELVNGVVRDLSFGELVRGDANDIAAEEDEESDDDRYSDLSSSEYETASETGSEDSSNDSVPIRPVARSATIAHPPHSGRSARTPQPPDQQRGRHVSKDDSETMLHRSRSRSIHRIKSLLSLNSKRKADVPPVPPVPPLPIPKHMPSSASSKAGLSSPARSSFDSNDSRPRRTPAQTQGVKSRKKRKQAPALKPPELVHIPKLLPIFREMMRPLIRPRSL